MIRTKVFMCEMIFNCHLFFFSSRYLQKTFSRAVRRAQPNVVVFLGDLMDEGHIAPAEHFEIYKRRLANIFDTSDDVMVRYYILFNA